MQRESSALRSPLISLQSLLLFYEATFRGSVCDDVCLCFFFFFFCILRSSVIMRPPVVMVAPSKQSGMSSFSCL